MRDPVPPTDTCSRTGQPKRQCLTQGEFRYRRGNSSAQQFPRFLHPGPVGPFCFRFRRYAMKPIPANPISIIAHVEGSGVAATVAIGVSPKIEPEP